MILSFCTVLVQSDDTFVAWLKAVDPSHQEFISVFISWNTERRRPDTADARTHSAQPHELVSLTAGSDQW